jgi:hypothetical protein
VRLQPKRLRDKLQIPQTYLDLPSFHLCQIAPVHPHPFGKLELRPPLRLSEFTNANSEADANVGGHPPMLVCSL